LPLGEYPMKGIMLPSNGNTSMAAERAAFVFQANLTV